jgi:hypothetical protein
MECLGVDPAEDIRGRFDSMSSLYETTGTRSLPLIFDRRLRRVGISRTRLPMYGDIAIIKPPGSDICGAIVTRGYVVLTRDGGLSRLRPDQARLVAAWSVAQKVDGSPEPGAQ